MRNALSRRELMIASGGAGVLTAILHGLPLAVAQDGLTVKDAAADGEPWAGFPRQDAKLVREIVGASHRDEKRVRELLDLRPALVNAWWDWSFGDWESPLGAASHTGRRNIAELLIERGARVDIFAAAMLGWTDVVKAFVAATPGVQRTAGPHGIPLLAHARAGDEAAAATVAYLESLGDAGTTPATRSLSETEAQAYVGRFQFGQTDDATFEVKFTRGQLSISRDPQSARLNCVGDHEFFPAGAQRVRIVFNMQDGKAGGLSVIEQELKVEARRIP